MQPTPDGLAQAFIIGREFVGARSVARWCSATTSSTATTCTRSSPARSARDDGATVFAYPVADPERYGVVEFDATGRVLSLEEKPAQPKSRYAVTGLYFYDNRVLDIARELEALRARRTRDHRCQPRLPRHGTSSRARCMGRGMAWLDTGTHESLLEASQFIATIEKRQGLKIACPEEIAYRLGYIDAAALERLGTRSRRTATGSTCSASCATRACADQG